MQTFQYVENKYVPSINLETLGKTYDTLEKGHQEAIKAKTALQKELAALPLNEKDEYYRRQFNNKLQAVIDSKTLYGNSYYALDDLMLEVGNLAMDEGMRGRLESNKNFEEYKDLVNKDNSLPQDYKDYYLANNPYHYEDKYDKNGNVIQGDIWHPTSTPTKHIPLSSAIEGAIKIAAEESGKGNVTRWLDENGQVTTDPNKAFDGEVFDTVTQEWHRLGRDKILKAINAVIDATPALKSSIEQDYNVAKWKHDEKVKQNPNDLIVDDMTTPDGKIISLDDFVQKQLDPFADVASYNRVSSTTTYGEGLKTYKAAQAAINKSNGDGYGYGDGDSDLETALDENSPGATKTVDYDAASKWTENVQNDIGELNEEWRKLFGRYLNVDMSFGTDNAWDNIISKAEKQAKRKGYSDGDVAKLKTKLYKLKRDASNNRDNLQAIRGKLSEDERQKFDFINRQKNGAAYDKNNPYDRQYAKQINNIFGNSEYIGFVFDDDNERTNFLSVLGGGEKDKWRLLGYEVKDIDGAKYVLLPKSHSRQLKQFADAYDKTDPRILGFMRSRPVAHFDKNFNYVKPITSTNSGGALNSSFISDEYLSRLSSSRGITALQDYVNDIDKSNKKVTEKYVPTKINYDSTLLPGGTGNLYKLDAKLQRGEIDNTQYNTMVKADKDTFENLSVNCDYPNVRMLYRDGIHGTLQEVKGSKERAEIGEQIKSAIAQNSYKVSFDNDPVYGPGCYITYATEKVAGTDEVKNANPKQYNKTVFVPGLVRGGFADKIKNDPYTKASNEIRVGNAIGSRINLLNGSEFSSCGSQYLKCNGGQNVTYNGFGVTTSLNLKSAAKVKQICDYVCDIKDGIMSGEITSENLKRMNDVVATLSTRLSSYIGVNDKIIYRSIISDLTR